MQVSRSIRCTIVERYSALGLCAAVAILAGCGGSQPLSSAPGTMPSDGTVTNSYSVCTAGGKGIFRRPSLVIRSNSGRNTLPSGLTPANLQAAYKLPSSTKGSGQIVADIEVCDNPNVASDQGEYRSEFDLPSGSFSKFNEYGEQDDYPPARKGLGVPIDVDVQMIVATCPNCTVYLIEANGLDQIDMETAEKTAVALGAHIVNNAWACTGYGCVDKSYFDAKNVTYVGLGAGGINQEIYPADFDTVVAVGGTYLAQGGGGKRGWTENVWQKSGGGCFTDDPKPAWQHATSCTGPGLMLEAQRFQLA
jgi:hypothetical protein